MKITRVGSILDNYSADSPGVKANLARIPMQSLAAPASLLSCRLTRGSAYPACSFAVNPDAYVRITISSLPLMPVC